jgi:hypothetical protein
MALTIAAAQPAPVDTSIAPTGQFIRHAPHCIQLPRSITAALRLTTAKTACGQTSAQRPQPLQRA